MRFDEVWERVDGALTACGCPPDLSICLVRDLRGKVRISAADSAAENTEFKEYLEHLARALHSKLGAYGCSPPDGLLFLDEALFGTLKETARQVAASVFRVERLVTGHDWGTSRDSEPSSGSARWTLYSVKGGVGRSTTAAVLSWHLAKRGEHVLVVDLDLESPGLSSAMLEGRLQPEFGVTDWFVEDLVGQGEKVIGDMAAAPPWAQDFDGDVRIVPAHGRVPGEYLEKLGRVYMDAEDDPWTERLARMLASLEAAHASTVVLLESRSGLHDIAAATVTDLNAQVLLFAVDSVSAWDDYEMIFRHWRDRDLATRMRDRLSVVSALTPDIGTDRYLEKFTESSWNLFREGLYDDLSGAAGPAEDAFSFALQEENAPHAPLPIYWTRGLAGGASLRDLDRTPVKQAYTRFLRGFDQLAETVLLPRR